MVESGGGVLPENSLSPGAEDGDAAEKTMIAHATTMAPPPVSAAARRPHEADPSADKAKRGDGYAERADDAGGTARPTAPVMAFPSFAEEVRRRARVQRGSRAAARALARRAQGGRALAGARADAGSILCVQDGTCCSSFLMFIGELEREGILTLQHGNVPPRLKGAAALVSMRSLATL